jgi:poly(A) polymerase
MNLMLENRSYSENSNNKTNIQRHHLSYRHQHRGKTTMSVTNEERLAELVCTAQRESGMLKHYLQKRQWLPHPECDSEKRRQTAMNILERVLCQWVASLHSLRPKKTGGNAWHRPRGTKGRLREFSFEMYHLLPPFPFAVTLVPFGSFRLQAHRPDSDLDVLCLCPDLCSRSDFFSSLPVLFEATAAIQDVHPIQFAYTPVIKMTVCGIAVDLLFGRVAGDQSRLLEFQQRSPSPLLVTASSLIAGSKRPAEYYMIQDLDLVGIDESMMRSFNGVRVTQFILDAVPDRQIFRALLCSVKEWATVQGIYSNTLGFLGGINFAILCAWICKRYPKLLPASLLRMFFRVYATWEWPKPVTLCEIQDLPPTGVSKMPAWNPETNPRDATHVMPIITPVYPSSELVPRQATITHVPMQ